MKAVKINQNRIVVDILPQVFTTHKECLQAARAAFGDSGALQFQSGVIVQ